ncbi:hypothetical protein D3C85_409380 [compost metagenome]
MQRVVRNAQRADGGPHVLLAPVGQRIELVKAERLVVLFLGQLAARRGLSAPLPGDPGAAARQRALERLDLADLATGFAQLHAFIEGKRAMRGHMLVHRGRNRPVHSDLASITLAHRVQHAQRLGMQPARVQGEHLEIQAGVIDGVRQHHILGRQRGRQRGVRITSLDIGQARGQITPANRQAGVEFGGKIGRRHGCTAKMRARRGRARRISPSRRSSSRYRDSGTSASISASESWRASSRYALGPAR